MAIELRATSYTVGSTAFTINAAKACQCNGSINRLDNGEYFELITCLSFPAVTTLVPVFISISGTSYPVLDQYGNILMSDQIRSRRRYKLAFGTNKGHFIVRQNLCPSQSTPTYLTIPTATAVSAGTTTETTDTSKEE